MAVIITERFRNAVSLAPGLLNVVVEMSIQFVFPEMGAIFDLAEIEAVGGEENLAPLSSEEMKEAIQYDSVKFFQAVAIVPLILLPIFGTIWFSDMLKTRVTKAA